MATLMENLSLQIVGRLEGSLPQPTLVEISDGWTIQLLNSEGKNVLSVPIFPHKFLAEQALASLLKPVQTKDE